MTVVQHIKTLIAGLTAKEKQEVAAYLAEPEMADRKPESLRGDWSNAFPVGDNLDNELREIRSAWEQEWRSEDSAR
ncbi:MAG TPA: hypothetical protein VLB46_04480 [Pyrinomonadaceae bacterium]|nr:hypothetical protein [Pyrinomonadaceae bacterium]